MRLIDADSLDEVFGIGRDCDHCEIGREKCEEDSRLATIEICGVIAEMPTVDALPVTRCRDCKYYSEREQFGVVMTECRYSACDVWTEPNGYCHRAKRRRKEGEQ